MRSITGIAERSSDGQVQIVRGVECEPVRAGGLTVQTTLDLGMQRAAEASVAHGLAQLQNHDVSDAAVVVLDPQNGAIRALVGGAEDQMISYFIAFYTNQTLNWGMAAALGLVLLAVTLILYGVYTKLAGTSGLNWR